MIQKESLDFLQSLIENVDGISKENIQRTKNRYESEVSPLPTKEEFEAANAVINFNFNPFYPYSEPRYQCPKCNEGGMCRDEMKIFSSNPPKYEYKCNKCGHTEFQYV